MTSPPSPADFARLPEAVAIIMDGNGRWAQERGLPRFKGHEVGAESVRAVTRECARLGIGELTLYAFSTENWRRPAQEVALLMTLLERYLVEERPEIMDNGIVFRAVGELDRLPASVQREYETTRAMSERNGGMVLRLALSYGGRRELLHAAQKVARVAVAEGLDAVERLGEDDLRQFLYDPTMRDPDLLIRTAGEMRVSNFLLWQASYAELHVADIAWPDFREAALHEALRAYGARARRFGGV
ncbi:MAG: polyprenyl diphosphate synthase [Planctomycetes bacterium]|nr:polyprenyl diphosphate synthase [Planctomycetota bacterium]